MRDNIRCCFNEARSVWDHTGGMSVQFPDWLLYLAVWLLILVGFTSKIVGQEPESLRLSRGFLIGHVTDTMGNPVSEADVVIARESDSMVLAVSRTNLHGVVRISQVPVGGPYVIFARMIGYQPADTSGISFREADTLSVTFVLRPRIVVLPEIAAKTKPQRLLAEEGFTGVRVFKCLFIGFGDARQLERKFCHANGDAHAARRAAKEVAGEIKRIMRRVEKAIAAGQRPEPQEAILVLNTVEACDQHIPERPPWPNPDPDVRCREVLKQISRETLARLGQELRALEATETFKDEIHREHQQVADQRAKNLNQMIAEAEAKYTAQEVQEAVRRVDQALKADRRPDSTDVLMVYDAAKVCESQLRDDAVLCHAILKQTSQKTLKQTILRMTARDSSD